MSCPATRCLSDPCSGTFSLLCSLEWLPLVSCDHCGGQLRSHLSSLSSSSTSWSLFQNILTVVLVGVYRSSPLLIKLLISIFNLQNCTYLVSSSFTPWLIRLAPSTANITGTQSCPAANNIEGPTWKIINLKSGEIHRWIPRSLSAGEGDLSLTSSSEIKQLMPHQPLTRNILYQWITFKAYWLTKNVKEKTHGHISISHCNGGVVTDPGKTSPIVGETHTGGKRELFMSSAQLNLFISSSQIKPYNSPI